MPDPALRDLQRLFRKINMYAPDMVSMRINALNSRLKQDLMEVLTDPDVDVALATQALKKADFYAVWSDVLDSKWGVSGLGR